MLSTLTAAAAVALLAIEDIAPLESAQMPPPDQIGKTVPPPADYEAVLRAEFRNAQAEGTREALIRFLARHSGHPLARQALATLQGAEGDALKTSFTDATDARVYAAFDRALRRNDVAGYDAFLARYANHPLAAEARRLREELEKP